MESKHLTRDQIGAIIANIKFGKLLQQRHPEIAILYRQGFESGNIVHELGIQEQYHVSFKIARNGVLRALSGYNGDFGLESYLGLLDEEERRRLAFINRSESASRIGIRAKNNRIGIFGLTREQRSENAKMGGNRALLEKKGLFAITKEQEHARSLKAGRNSTIARGQVPFSEREKEFAYSLTLRPEYQWQFGSYKVRPNWNLIRQSSIENGFPERTLETFRSIIGKYIRLK